MHSNRRNYPQSKRNLMATYTVAFSFISNIDKCLFLIN